MDSTRVARGLRHPVIAGFAVATAIGVALGLIGPFGSYLNGSLWVRVAYWVLCLWVGWMAFGVSVPALERWARGRRVPVWAWVPLAVAALAVPPALVSRLLALWLWPVVERVGWLEWYGQCLAVSALVTGGVLWSARLRGARLQGASGVAARPLSADPRDRLPARLGRTVLCLQMEDHYVRVHTDQGSCLVLMSLSQAIAGLKGVEGAQTHRSWWVARSAIAGVIEDGRNLRLRLAGGLEAPVSRARVGQLRADGWLSPAP